MKSFKSSLLTFPLLTIAAIAAAGLFASSASAQLIAYDDAGNYLVSANWTNGANQGFGFMPWTITTNGPDSHGTYVASGNNPTFVIASVTNVLGTNYTDVWGTYANGPTDINETTAFRGFTNSLGTNTFKIQWGSRGAGVTTTVNNGPVHGWCGFTLRNGNATASTSDFQTGTRLYIYFEDGASPSTLYVWDATNDGFPIPVTGTSFSDLGRANITNAVEAEVTVAADGNTYHLVLKDCVANRTLYTLDSTLMGSGTIDSVALFNHETTGDQIYNRMQIAASTNIPPTIVNLEPADGSLYLSAGATNLSFEVDSFNSTVSSNLVKTYLNGVPLPNPRFNTTSSTTQLLGTNSAVVLAANNYYVFTITAQDANGNVVSNNYTFNTFLASDLYIDAYDYNYNAGQFVNALTPSNSYANLFGTNFFDYFESDLTGTNNLYRPGDLPQVISLATDTTGDPVDHANLRQNGFTAYNIGFTDAGEWENYTRAVPTATNYNIYARAASAGGGQFEIERLAAATATITNQPLAALGRVNVPNTGGSRVYSGQLMPLTDVFGNTVAVPLSGTNTLRCTAISARGYNLEYLVVVPTTNATGTLRPYVAVGSPVPNATGVALNSGISFTIANRNTTANTNTIQLILNSTNISSRLVMSSNAVGVTATWSPTNNLPANFTNTISIIFTDSTGTSLTNSWIFFTGSVGGALGNGLWTGGGGADMNWSTAANWTGGTPGPGFNASFASLGATNTLATNNIVATNITILGLYYNTNTVGFHTTWIQDGVTLLVTNGSTAIGAIVQVGGTTGGDNAFNLPVTNTITGANGTLLVQGNSQTSGQLNQLNFQVRQNAAGVNIPNLVTLDMSGLGTLNATVGKFYVAQGGSGANQTNVSGCVNLARTNIIICLRANAGQFEVGDSSGGLITVPGSTLNLGLTNALYLDTVRFGKQKATNNLVRFNPIFTNNASTAAFIRGTNGLASRVSVLTIGDADTETTVPNFVQANVDLSGGKLDALVTTMVLGRGETSASDSGYAQGTLTLTAGNFDVINLTNGVQRANNTATETGIVNVLGTATLVSPNIILAQAAAGATASLVSGNLNITNGTVRGNILAGGGVSTVNVSGGSLVVSNAAGTTAAPLSALHLVSAALHLKADGNSTITNVNATAVSASGSTITIDSVVNVTATNTIHLVGYTGADPFAGLSLAMPSGFAGQLLDNSGVIDLKVWVSAPPPPPTIRNIAVNTSGQVILGGTNNNGAGGTFKVYTATNLTTPLASWSLLTNGNFDANGNFSTTNATGTNSQRFYILQVP